MRRLTDAADILLEPLASRAVELDDEATRLGSNRSIAWAVQHKGCVNIVRGVPETAALGVDRFGAIVCVRDAVTNLFS